MIRQNNKKKRITSWMIRKFIFSIKERRTNTRRVDHPITKTLRKGKNAKAKHMY